MLYKKRLVHPAIINDNHVHFICDECNKIISVLGWEAFPLARPSKGFKPQISSEMVVTVEFVGHGCG